MIAVIGGAGAVIRLKMKPQTQDAGQRPVEENERFDYDRLNIAEERSAGDDDISVQNSGCGFHIAIRLVQMGHDVAFLSAVGDDPLGFAVLEQLKTAGVNVDYVKMIKGTTPVKVELLNVLGDAEISQANHRLYENITPEMTEDWEALLSDAQAIVMDGHLPQDTIEHLAVKYGTEEAVKIFFDPADVNGAGKARKVLDKIHCIMPGRLEAEAMAQRTILSEDQLMEAGGYFMEAGVSKVIITMKGGGLYYKEGMREGILRPERILSFANTSGAGDMVSAAVIAGALKNQEIETTAAQAMEMAAAFLSDLKDEKPI